MAASMCYSCVRHFSKVSSLNARPGYPPSLRTYETVLPRVPRILEGSEPQYPPIRPSITSGSVAGKKARRDAWIESLRCSERPPEMIYQLQKKQQWQHKVKPFNFQMGFSKYFRQLTKTVVVDDLPQQLESLMEEDYVSAELNTLKDRFKEVLLTDAFSTYRHRPDKTSLDQEKSQTFAQNAVMFLLSYLGLKYSHLSSAVVDEQCLMKSFWERNEKRVQFIGNPVCSIRTKDPLGQFVPVSDELCQQEIEDWPWDPKELGIFPKCINSVCFPGFKYQPNNLHPHTQVYGLNFNKKRTVELNIFQEIQENFGVMAGYAWLNALGMYQHYCWFKDIPQPMTAQIIFTDGKSLSFYCYQANTLNLRDADNPLSNVCFQRLMVPMFTDIKDGVVRDFNEDALRLMLAFFINPTVKA
ncbi:28S ribosomal protein S30, mitochondrial [Holothuria leucospilota]|uniref:28S ribosomal protein S30, mitochondrial n=1 Tax=Holothuria leucospilota TaxID=206669 RepID=A0A9Q1BLQ8_HOLLE|nr:28S ribosomal protein S30, mitochondrial [Holothuria leucospilota]